ncbi:hypothetical protein D3C85_1304870 [compost metagenome]
MRSLVFFTPNSPAARANSKTSPLGIFRCSMASIVSGLDTLTVAVAMAILSVFDFFVMFTISAVFLPLMSFILKYFLSPDREFRF